LSAEDINKALSDMTPEFLNRALGADASSRSLVLPETGTQRTEALALLRNAMWHEPSCALHMVSPTRLRALKALKPHLAPGEFVSLYDGAPQHVPPQDVYELALALMAHGVATASPAHITRAQAHLQSLQRALPLDSPY
jgi:hypothetical protein